MILSSDDRLTDSGSNKRQYRLARKAALARQSRSKRRQYVKQLEVKVEQLQQQIESRNTSSSSQVSTSFPANNSQCDSSGESSSVEAVVGRLHSSSSAPSTSISTTKRQRLSDASISSTSTVQSVGVLPPTDASTTSRVQTKPLLESLAVLSACGVPVPPHPPPISQQIGHIFPESSLSPFDASLGLLPFRPTVGLTSSASVQEAGFARELLPSFDNFLNDCKTAYESLVETLKASSAAHRLVEHQHEEDLNVLRRFEALRMLWLFF